MDQRITPAMITGSTVNDINSALSALERSSSELSSGKKILEPSDNPYGASQVIDLQSQLDGLSSFAANAKDGVSWATTSESAMQNVGELLQRVRTLNIQASNGTYNQSNLNSLATEVTQIAETIKQDANVQYAGQYVFAGTKTTTPPYQQGETDTYAGNAETVSRTIGPGASVTVSTNISTLLGNGAESKDGKLLDVLRTISQHLTEGTAESKAALNSTDLKSLEANIETLSQLQSVNGSTTNQLKLATSRIEALQGAISATLSNTEDANLAETSIAFSNEQAAYTAALRSAASIVQESLLNFLH
ncbi:MAG TPA: flagellar hook-associated protein FlgL [Solirubrobacteraceae bacterium]|jgi:flagellar hook-associated protein 3 FlgL|nr:flagellar hook-associated protein FlgL [Solirubrobacteraceae bacterium]